MQILFVVVTFSCKIAACLLIHRLTCHKNQRIYALAVALASAVFCLVSLMALSIGIGSGSPWTDQLNEATTVVSPRWQLIGKLAFSTSADTTRDKTNRWIAYAVLANLIDFCIVILAITLVYNLEMKPARKSKIVAIFALRLGYVSM